MATFLAETYLSRDRASDLEAITERLRDVEPVRHLFSYFVADDETAFHCLRGPTPDAVRSALERAGLAPDRVVRASYAVAASSGPREPPGGSRPRASTRR